MMMILMIIIINYFVLPSLHRRENCAEDVSNPTTGLERPLGLLEVEAPSLSKE
jgi:hypothetical protein